MPFKYREKRNAYFKEYMRKWRAEKRNQQAMEEEISGVPSDSEFEPRKEHLKSSEVRHYEILAA